MPTRGITPPWVVRASGRLQLESLTTPIGMFPEIAALTRTIQLRVGDWLLIASDGIPEARGESGEEFGDGGVLDLLGRADISPDDFCNRVIDAVASLNQNQPADDLTLIAARVLPPGSRRVRNPA